jgi:hypothetical protein
VQDQADKAADYFVSLGIPADHVSTANALQQSYQKTEIIDFSGKRYTAERLASWLHLSKDRIRKATANDMVLRTSEADIVVILGADAKIENALAAPTR